MSHPKAFSARLRPFPCARLKLTLHAASSEQLYRPWHDRFPEPAVFFIRMAPARFGVWALQPVPGKLDQLKLLLERADQVIGGLAGCLSVSTLIPVCFADAL